ncbi:MAG: DUF2723 domain-containing protein [Candidatus Eisenbacteria bacterium]
MHDSPVPPAPAAPAAATAAIARLGWPMRLALAAPAALLYAALAPRVVGEGDSAELTLALVQCGVPHPPGYPLWTLAGSAFVHALHAVGVAWAHAANLWSAASASLAVLFAISLADELVDVALPRAARACLLAAVPLVLVALPTFLRAATQAEVYAFEAAWTAVIAWHALRTLRGVESAKPFRRRDALGWGLLAGVALAHRPTMLATAVPLALALLRVLHRRGTLRVDRIAVAIAGALVPAATYALVLWRARHPAAFQWPLLEPGLAGLLRHASGGVYAGYLVQRDTGGAGAALFTGTLAPVLALGLAGALASWRGLDRTTRTFATALAASGLLQCLFAALYGVTDFDFFLLPVVVFAVLALVRGAAEQLRRAADPLAPAALLLTALAFVAALPVAREVSRLRVLADVDASVREAFLALPFDEGIVVWNTDSHARLVALQQLEGHKPRVVVLDGRMLTWPRPRAEAARRLGFDPLGGLELRTDADLEQLAPSLAARSGRSVAEFGTWWANRPRR